MGRDDAREAQGRPLPPALPRRPVLPHRPLARARRRARVPALAHPRQGRLRVQGRARLRAARRTSTRASTRNRSRVAVRRAASARPRSGSPSASPGWSSATSAASAADPARPTARASIFETEYADSAPLVPGCSGSASTPACSSPPELVDEAAERARPDRRAPPQASPSVRGSPRRADGRAPPRRDGRPARRRETPIRPERFARLVTLAGDPDRGGPHRRDASQVSRGVRAASRSPSRSCARTSTC